MTSACPIGFDIGRLRRQVQATYERVARAPEGEFHFRRGLEYAVTELRYDREELLTLPSACTRRFAGIGNPLRVGPIAPGETVLDHACGAGMDLLLAAHRAGPAGRAIGVDMTPDMCDCATSAAREARLAGIVDVRQGFFEELPVRRGVDCVISNGVLNPRARKRFASTRTAAAFPPTASPKCGPCSTRRWRPPEEGVIAGMPVALTGAARPHCEQSQGLPR